MKIAFLLWSTGISGGTYVIFEHATRLQRKGNQVVIITENKPTEDDISWHPNAKELSYLTYKEAEKIDFDITFATWWKTVFELKRVNSKHYAYFVQSIETKFIKENTDKPLTDLIESTYSLNLPTITESTWINKYLFEKHGNTSYIVKNGIRKDIYTLDGETYEKREEGKLRILIEGPIDVWFKNIPKTIELCRKANVGEIWLLTSSQVAAYEGVSRVYSKVPITETPKIYRSCDVIVKLSYVEGMFGPPLEMFHCGGTAIVYDVTGHDEYIKHQVNALVVKKDDDEKVIKYLQQLSENKDLLKKLKKSAILTAANWNNWEQSSLDFEKSLVEIMKNKETNYRLCINTAEKHMDHYNHINNLLTEINNLKLPIRNRIIIRLKNNKVLRLILIRPFRLIKRILNK